MLRDKPIQRSEVRVIRRASLGVMLASLLSACGPGSLPYPAHGAKRFDPAEWAKADENMHTRSDMVSDLLNRYRLIGRTRNEVINLLGQPEQKPHKFSDYDLVYVLGPDRTGMPIDFEWMLIKLDDRGRVARIKFASD
jgi:hypothetical protein